MPSDSTTHRRLAAIMFSDLCGYSRIMGRDEHQAMRILALHDALLNDRIAAHGGRVIKRMGDGVLAEFASAVAAVECAMAIQRASAGHNAAAPPEDQFHLRIGVHLGDVVVTNGDILGDGVNVASRIEPLAEPGGICISQDVYNQVHNKVEIQAVSLGPQQLKNIQRQIEIYRVIVAAAASELAPAEAAGEPAAEPAAEAEPAPEAPITSEPPQRRRAPWVLGALALVVLVLVAGVVLQRQTAARRAERALKLAATHLEASEPAQACAVLDDALRQVRPGMPRHGALQELRAKAGEAESKQLLQQRFEALTASLFQKNWEAAAQLAAPQCKMRLGIKNISGRMALLGFFAEVLRVKPGDFRIREITLGQDLTNAVVIPELRQNNVWNAQAPMRWQFADQQWWLVVE